jgi:hypothetical protein
MQNKLARADRVNRRPHWCCVAQKPFPAAFQVAAYSEKAGRCHAFRLRPGKFAALHANKLSHKSKAEVERGCDFDFPAGGSGAAVDKGITLNRRS